MRSRREFVKAGLSAALVLPAAPALLAGALSGCGSSEPTTPPASKDPKPTPPAEPAPPAAPPPAADAGGKLVTDIPGNATLVTSLQYVGRSAKPDQRCSNCQFYTATDGELGKCTLFQQGLVEAQGWCASWTKKVENG